jgi:16S rRNA (guanine966-N2)-methyltransferase
LRIIAGQAGGRRLKAPRDERTRPTLARVRESIFSRLGSRIDLGELRVLDLFAGTGALGIEALSRGSALATFVDNSRLAVQAINRNLATLNFESRARVLCGEVRHALVQLVREGESFDLVFLDPPYGTDLGLVAIGELVRGALLSRDAWVVLEVSRRDQVPLTGGLHCESVATLGDHRIALYRREEI